MRLHAEVPLVTLLGLVHLRIAERRCIAQNTLRLLDALFQSAPLVAEGDASLVNTKK
jgi:hypothetical protein